MNRLQRTWLLLLLALAAPLTAASTGAAAIAPPWCGTPVPDAAAALPDGRESDPSAGQLPARIPYYAIGCTLDSIAAQSGGRMKVEVIGQSALGRDMFLVTINELDTENQRRDSRTGGPGLNSLSRFRPGAGDSDCSTQWAVEGQGAAG